MTPVAELLLERVGGDIIVHLHHLGEVKLDKLCNQDSVAEIPGEVPLGSGQRDVVYPEVQLVQSLLIHAAFH